MSGAPGALGGEPSRAGGGRTGRRGPGAEDEEPQAGPAGRRAERRRRRTEGEGRSGIGGGAGGGRGRARPWGQGRGRARARPTWGCARGRGASVRRAWAGRTRDPAQPAGALWLRCPPGRRRRGTASTKPPGPRQAQTRVCGARVGGRRAPALCAFSLAI